MARNKTSILNSGRRQSDLEEGQELRNWKIKIPIKGLKGKRYELNCTARS